jgi:hypothetical protein
MELVDELVAVLVAEAGEYQRLLPLLEEEEQVLVRADAAGLSGLAARRDVAASRLVALERDRRAALGRLGVRLGVDPRSLTISRLVELAPAAAQALSAVRDQLRDVLGRLLARLNRNRFLAERTLDCLRGLFASLAAALAPTPAYAPSGRSERRSAELGLLDRRA